VKNYEKTKAQATEREPEAIFVNEKSRFERFILVSLAFIFGWACGVFLVLFMILQYPPIANYPILINVVWYLIPILLAVTAWRRNKILSNMLKNRGHRYFLNFAYVWGKLVLVMTPVLMGFYFIAGISDIKFVNLALLSFFLLSTLYMIFNDPLTERGEIILLFEMLKQPTENFQDAARYWKKLAHKIENMLREGNVAIKGRGAGMDLVHYFSKKILETDEDISDDLQCIKEWMLGTRKSCFEGLWGLSHEIEFVPCPKNTYLDWALKNPDVTVKYAFYGVLAIISIIFSPTLLNELLSHVW
jgi:hypothetical protein